jgi:DNA polymerase III epsilon subunit-like protein
VSIPIERLVFVDVETAGIEPPLAIIQIAAVAVNSRLREEEAFEIKLHRDGLFQGIVTHGHRHFNAVTWQHCAIEPRQAARAFGRFLRRHATVDAISVSSSTYQVAQLVAHNANFDGPLLQDWFAGLGTFFPASFRVLCTMQRAIWFFCEYKKLTPPRDFRLDTLCEYFAIPRRSERAHDALADARATVQLYRAILDEAKRAA